MPKLNDFQNSTITLLDYLYFHDIVAMETFTEDKLTIYGKLVNLLDSVAYKKFDDEFRVEHYKHLLMVGLDFELVFRADNLTPQNFEYKELLLKYRGYLVLQLKEASFQIDEYEKDLQWLLIQIHIDQIDKTLAFKIVSQVLYYEYDNITVGVFSKFLDEKFLTVSDAKYQKNQKAIYSKFVDKLFFRAMLFLEFEVFKNDFLMELNSEDQKVDLNHLDDYQKVISVIKAKGKARSLKSIDYSGISTVKTPNELKKFLLNVADRLGHNPIFSDNLANWISLIGAWHLILEKKTNSDKPLFKESPTYVLDSGISCAKLARKKLHDYGFIVSEKTVFECYDRVFELYRFIRLTVESCLDDGICGRFERILTQDFFYNPNTKLLFKEQLKIAKARL